MLTYIHFSKCFVCSPLNSNIFSPDCSLTLPSCGRAFPFVLCAALQEQVGVCSACSVQTFSSYCALHDSISMKLWRLVHLIQL